MELKIGDKAPSFSGKNQDGKTISLSDFKGKKLVLYFYPKDNTPGCTAEANNLKDNYQEFLNAGYAILGVSTDSEESHKKFIEKYQLPFDLIADTDEKIVNEYGVWVEKNMYGRKYMGIKRTTFVIDENQIIIDIIEKVKTDDHTSQILK